MPQMQDIVKKSEKPNNLDQVEKPGAAEQAPGSVDVEKKPEIPVAPESAEVQPEITEQPDSASPTEVASPTPSTAPQKPLKDKELEKIEDVLEEDLEEVYFKMTPEKQAEFQKAGEETASKISVLLKDTHVKVKKILELIRNWLKIIPGINKFFLEQEVKIKADKILDIKESEKESPPQEQGGQNKI